MFRAEQVSVIGCRARCTCGWSSRDWWFRGLAVVSAWFHSGSTAHMPTVPLQVAA